MDLLTCNYCGQHLVTMSHVVWLRSYFQGQCSSLSMLVASTYGCVSNWLSLVSEWSWVLKKIFKLYFYPSFTKMLFPKEKIFNLAPNSGESHLLFQMKTPKDSNEKDRPQNHREVESLFYSAPHLLVQFLASYTCFPYFSAKKLASKGCVSLYRPPCCTTSFDRSLKILTEDEQNGKLNLGALLPCVWKLWVTLLFAWKMSWFSQVSVFFLWWTCCLWCRVKTTAWEKQCD